MDTSTLQPFIDAILSDVKQQALQQITAAVNAKIASVDVNSLVGQMVLNQVQLLTQNYNFPDSSISPSAIRVADLKITGDNISGGKIERFSSYGIQDTATNNVVCVGDNSVDVSTTLNAKNVIVSGDATISGNLNVTGNINAHCGDNEEVTRNVVSYLKNDLEFYSSYKEMLFNDLSNAGLSVNSLKVNDRVVLDGNKLGTSIIESNLQKLGYLNDIQVRGSAEFANTMVVISKRVGINTTEPNYTLDLWDQEVEIIAGKKEGNVGIIGTGRDNALVLSSNGKENIKLNSDGSTSISNLIVDQTKMKSSPNMPVNDEPIGTVVWNTLPEINSSIGWVSLGGARWASFGTIQ